MICSAKRWIGLEILDEIRTILKIPNPDTPNETMMMVEVRVETLLLPIKTNEDGFSYTNIQSNVDNFSYTK